jgi:hypothetical protein
LAKQVAFGVALAALLALGSTAVGAAPPAPTYSCQGFEPPMNLASLPPAMGGGVIARKVPNNRVLPFKATLVDTNGNLVTKVVAAPRFEVRFNEDVNGPEADVAEYALLSGNGSAGNAFELSGNLWQFKLKPNDFSASERYTATMKSGDTNEYLIEPTCEGVFLIK